MSQIKHFCLLLLIAMMGASCRGRVGGNEKTESAKTDSVTVVSVPKETLPAIPEKTTVRIFVENSGSMNGFINNSSDFQIALSDQITLLKHYYDFENIKLYYINQSVYPQIYNGDESGLNDFAKGMLDKRKFTTTGKVGSTKLNDILKMALDSVDEHSISIVISDCIYSVSGTGTSETMLGLASSTTFSNFLAKTKKISSLSTMLVQLYSNFDGGYWDYKHPSGTPSAKLQCKRPYYLCIMGTYENIQEYNKNIDVTSMDGFANQCEMSTHKISDTKASIMNHKGMDGCSYRAQIVDSTVTTIKNVREVNGRRLCMFVGINLSDFSMTEIEKMDTANYRIDGNYEIVSIEKVDVSKLKDPYDKQIVQKNGLTHYVNIRAIGHPNDFTISVKQSIPTWVYNSSSYDDSNIGSDAEQQRKTFGLSYLVDGIVKAYDTTVRDNDNYTRINFNVR